MNNVSLGLVLLVLLGILALCGWFVKRRFIDKRWPSSGTQLVTRMIYKQYETREHRDAIDEMEFIEQEDRDEDRGGDKPVPGEDA
jgi:hypothetical protein